MEDIAKKKKPTKISVGRSFTMRLSRRQGLKSVEKCGHIGSNMSEATSLPMSKSVDSVSTLKQFCESDPTKNHLDTVDINFIKCGRTPIGNVCVCRCKCAQSLSGTLCQKQEKVKCGKVLPLPSNSISGGIFKNSRSRSREPIYASRKGKKKEIRETTRFYCSYFFF